MKKYLALFLSFIIICSAALIAVQVYAADDSDTVVYTQTTVAGDKKEADGIKLGFKLQCDSHLRWDIEYTLGENEEYNVSFEHYYDPPQVRTEQSEQFYLSFGLNNFGASTSGDLLDDLSLFGQYDMIADVASRTPSGEKRTETLKVIDYYEYYPLSFSVNLGDAQCSEYWEDSDSGKVWKYGEMFDKMAARLSEYFRIPVSPDEKIVISVTKSADGRVIEANSKSSEYDNDAVLYTNTLIADDAIYFTIEPHIDHQSDEMLDISMVEGGYGIYRIPYEFTDYDSQYFSGDKYTDIKIDELEMVYPLDTEAEVEGFRLSDDGSVIYLTTVRRGVSESEVFLNVIDRETMTDIQAIPIFTCESDDWIYIHSYNENFILYWTAYEKLAVVEKDENGLWKTAFVTEIAENMECDAYDMMYDSSAAFDGERLALAKYTGEYRSEASHMTSFYLALYSADGNIYTGRYDCSLDTGSFLSYNNFCKPLERPAEDTKPAITLP